jgi:transposase
VRNIEQTKNLNLNTATFVGIDAHPSEHTALAMNRFEEEKGILRFDNTKDGIREFVAWLQTLEVKTDQMILGIEGGAGLQQELLRQLTARYAYVFEVNPVYTRQRRAFGTRSDKSDPFDAKLIAEVLTKKAGELPRITKRELLSQKLILKKTVWFYEEVTLQGARIKPQAKQTKAQYELCSNTAEKRILGEVLKDQNSSLSLIRKQQRKLEKSVKDLLDSAGGGNLVTIPGIGTILAGKIIAHTGGIERFQTIDKFIKYAGIAPTERSSGKSKRYVKNTKGNRKLTTTFYLAALGQICWNPKAKVYYQKKIAEGKSKKQALVCVMKRIAMIIYAMLKSGEAYRG